MHGTRNYRGSYIGIGKMDKSYHDLIVERRNSHIMIIKINRPTVKNALQRRTVYELLRAIDAANNDASITLIVLTGTGDAFTAGNDLTQMATIYPAGGIAVGGHSSKGNDALSVYMRGANFVLSSLIKKMIYCKKILVALVNGACVGIGFTLCALCDVVYCTERAYFWAPFSELGICMEACASITFPMILGRAKASEVLLFGERLSAADALAYNFVAGIFTAEELDTIFWTRMQKYAQLPAESLRAGKRLMWQAHLSQLLDALKLECGELEKLRYSDVYLSKIVAFAKTTKRSKL